MEKILIVSKTPASIEKLSDIIEKCGAQLIKGVLSARDAAEKLDETEYDIIVINAPLADDSGLSLAQKARAKDVGIVLLINSDVVDKVQEVTEELGAFLVEKPINPPLLIQGIRFVAAAQKRYISLRLENSRLAQKVEDIKVINRAKCCLMQTLNLSESAAHRYIEKQAMDTRKPKRHVAERILKTYEF